MNKPHVRSFVPGIVAATTLVLTATAGAQTPAPAAPSPTTQALPAAPMAGHHAGHSTKGAHHADMKKECAAMMATHREMQEKLQAMDATMDKLVAEMNAARDSKAVNAMERPMAAVLNELVAQRKASRSMLMEMQHGSMQHMSHHEQMNGGKGAMECPMMKKDDVPSTKGAS